MPDTATLHSQSQPISVEYFDVLIVGAGISGIGAAYHLGTQCPEKRFVVLENEETFGGTWWTHKYPGIRSDSDLHTFGYRFKPWRGAPIATAEEILRYMGEVIAENDLARRCDGDNVKALLAGAEKVVVLDLLETDTAEAAHLAIPVASFAESEGTLVSSEGRAQRFFPPISGSDEQPATWRWLADAAALCDRKDLAALTHVDAVLNAVAADCPALAGAVEAAPGAAYRDRVGLKVARQPARYSGRTAMYADKTLHEPKTKIDEESGLAFSMEGDNRSLPSALQPFVWEPGWNSNQSLHKFQAEVGGAMRGGSAGVRLITPGAGSLSAVTAPTAFTASGQGWTLTAQHKLFGSDELSAESAAIQAMMSLSEVSLNPEDAERLAIGEHDGVALNVGDVSVRCAVRQDAGVPTGTAGFTTGHPDTSGLFAGQVAALERIADLVRPPEVIAREVANG